MDKPEDQAIAEHEKLADSLLEKYGPHSYVFDEQLDEYKRLWDLARANVAFFTGGWKGYGGCVIERQLAEHYGLEILED